MKKNKDCIKAARKTKTEFYNFTKTIKKKIQPKSNPS